MEDYELFRDAIRRGQKGAALAVVIDDEQYIARDAFRELNLDGGSTRAVTTPAGLRSVPALVEPNSLSLLNIDHADV